MQKYPSRNSMRWRLAAGRGSFTGVRIGIGIAQGLALGAELPMIGVSTLATMAEGAWRKTGATRVLAAIDARMGEVYWAEYQRDEQGVWQGEESEAVLNPQAVMARLQQLDGQWATVGTGWAAGRRWPARVRCRSSRVKPRCQPPKICCRLPVACLLSNARLPLSMPNLFICVTKWHGRNFRAGNESQ